MTLPCCCLLRLVGARSGDSRHFLPSLMASTMSEQCSWVVPCVVLVVVTEEPTRDRCLKRVPENVFPKRESENQRLYGTCPKSPNVERPLYLRSFHGSMRGEGFTLRGKLQPENKGPVIISRYEPSRDITIHSPLLAVVVLENRYCSIPGTRTAGVLTFNL